jgi:hypothetical protein
MEPTLLPAAAYHLIAVAAQPQWRRLSDQVSVAVAQY